MESSSSRIALETEIVAGASKIPLVFDPEKAAFQIDLVLKMLLKVNSLYQNKSSAIKECAILFKRFCIYSDTIIRQMPITMITNFQGKIQSLKAQIIFAEAKYKEIINQLCSPSGP